MAVHLDHIVLLEDDDFPGQEFRPTLDPSTIYTPADTIFGGLIKYGVFQPAPLKHFELFDRSRRRLLGQGVFNSLIKLLLLQKEKKSALSHMLIC